MLSRIFTGTLLSIGCIVGAQFAEQAFEGTLAELETALAAPTAPAAVLPCPDGALPPCLFAGETPPLAILETYAECELPDIAIDLPDLSPAT